MADASEKKCATCGLLLPVDGFYKNSRKKDGLSRECKKCQAKYARSYRLENPSSTKKAFCNIDEKIKECLNCHMRLGFDLFYPEAHKLGGRSTRCIKCITEIRRSKRRSEGRRELYYGFCDVDKQIKECSKCKVVLPFDAFTKDINSRGGVCSQCRKCVREYDRMKSYGLTPAQHRAMIEKQRGMCAICENIMDAHHVDHCHDTGKVRGLLCGQCNQALGLFKDNQRSLARAIDYLKASLGES